MKRHVTSHAGEARTRLENVHLKFESFLVVPLKMKNKLVYS